MYHIYSWSKLKRKTSQVKEAVVWRPGRKLGNLGKLGKLGILFPTFSLPTFWFWPNTQNRKLGRRKLRKKFWAYTHREKLEKQFNTIRFCKDRILATPNYCLHNQLRYWVLIIKSTVLAAACRVQIWRKTFCQNSDKFGYS